MAFIILQSGFGLAAGFFVAKIHIQSDPYNISQKPFVITINDKTAVNTENIIFGHGFYYWRQRDNIFTASRGDSGIEPSCIESSDM